MVSVMVLVLMSRGKKGLAIFGRAPASAELGPTH